MIAGTQCYINRLFCNKLCRQMKRWSRGLHYIGTFCVQLCCFHPLKQIWWEFIMKFEDKSNRFSFAFINCTVAFKNTGNRFCLKKKFFVILKFFQRYIFCTIKTKTRTVGKIIGKKLQLIYPFLNPLFICSPLNAASGHQDWECFQDWGFAPLEKKIYGIFPSDDMARGHRVWFSGQLDCVVCQENAKDSGRGRHSRYSHLNSFQLYSNNITANLAKCGPLVSVIFFGSYARVR